MPQEPRKPIDWEAVEREYRAGQLSVREIARTHNLSEGAIRKKAKAEGWQRALTEKIRDAVREELVRGTQDGAQSVRDDEDIVRTHAAIGADVVRQHRHAIGRGRDLTLRLLDELDATTTKLGELEEMISAETAKDKDPRRRTAMHKAIALPSRAGVIKDLSTAAKNWVALERQAFSLDKPDEPSKTGIEVTILHDPDRG